MREVFQLATDVSRESVKNACRLLSTDQPLRNNTEMNLEVWSDVPFRGWSGFAAAAGERGARAVAVIFAAEESAKTGKVMPALPENRGRARGENR